MNTCTYASTTSGTASTDYVWNTWSGNTASSSTSTTTYTDTVWVTWTSDSTSTGNATATTSSGYVNVVWNDWVEDTEVTPYEQVAPVEQDQSDDFWEKKQKERKEAENKAVELLEVLIGKEQTKIYQETGRVFLKGKKFDYHIVKGSGFNIRKIEKNRVVDLCAHISKSIYPDTDNVVALLLALQDDEEGVLKLANERGSSDDMPINNFPRAAVAGG
jgi:hypothetical protein